MEVRALPGLRSETLRQAQGRLWGTLFLWDVDCESFDGLVKPEVVADSDGHDGIDLEHVEVVVVDGDLRVDVAGELRKAVDAGAVGLRLVGANNAIHKVQLDGWRTDEGGTDFKGNREVAAAARDEVSPAGGHGEGGVGVVEKDAAVA